MLARGQDQESLMLDGLDYMVKSRGVEAPDGAGADKHDVDGPVRVRAGLQALESSHCCDGRRAPLLGSRSRSSSWAPCLGGTLEVPRSRSKFGFPVCFCPVDPSQHSTT